MNDFSVPGLDLESTPEELQQALREAVLLNLRGTRALASAMETPVGLTPKDQIWAINKTKLYRYRPVCPPEERHKVPLLLVYALINKPYIFDLQPGKSLVEYLLGEGFDVYLLDWGSPGPEDKNITFNDYALQYLPRAVRKVLRTSGSKTLSMLGYCIGAPIATLYAAVHPDGPLQNLILLTPPLDFSDRKANAFTVWLDERYIDVDKMVDTLGNIPVEIIETGAKLLKPGENYIGSYVSLWSRIESQAPVEGWQAMHKWVHDGVPFAGEAFRQWVKEYLRENKLITNRIVIDGGAVNLSDIKVPLLVVVAEYDHIVPLSQSTTILDAVGSTDKHMEMISAGHVGIVIGSRAKHNLWPKISSWLGERSS